MIMIVVLGIGSVKLERLSYCLSYACIHRIKKKRDQGIV
jgi:hypothetical protein